MKFFRYTPLMIAASFLSCQSQKKENSATVRLITLDPGHFHAALVQKSMYDDVDSTVYVYAPKGPEVQSHLDKINAYNADPKKPTHWKEEVYLGDDFLQKMLAEKKGNVVVIAGNNKNKTEYIKKSIDAGLNVLGDKPMAIDAANFELLKTAFADAAQKKVLLYDIMTERYEITNRLQREFALMPEVFGTLQKGTADNPAIQMESVHYFYKYVSGNVLTRPSWFMDVSQQGEGIADVATHLVDLVQWGFFPEKTIDYKKDIQLNSARRWSTDISLSQFSAITNQSSFPDYLSANVYDSILKVFANGEINYQLNGTFIKLIAKWDYIAHEGSGDTHNATVRGTKANLVIRQGPEQAYKPTLYIEPVAINDAAYENALTQNLKALQAAFPGVELKKTGKGWEVVIPEKYKEGHEAHFAMVTQKFLTYLKEGNMPSWEVPNMLAKYYTTTQALELAKRATEKTATIH
jgi:predicted dehydrogenase